MKTTTFIYALFEGETVRYIGKSNDPKRRFRMHLKDAYTSHKCSWVKSLINKGQKPILEVLDEVPLTKWEFWEQHYISLFKSWGFDLVNMNEGGTGGGVQSDEALLKVSNIHKGKKLSEEHKKRLSELKKGRKLSAEHAAAFASYWKGKKRSDEDKAKKSEALKGRKISNEAISKMRASLTGRKLSEEHKAKILGTGRTHSEETRAKISASQKGVRPTQEALKNQSKGQQLRWQKYRDNKKDK